MIDLNIDPNWDFKNIVVNLRALKLQYEGILASFSYIELPEKVEFMKKTRDTFYSLNYEEWKKDKLWEYMNGFECIETLICIVNRQKY